MDTRIIRKIPVMFKTSDGNLIPLESILLTERPKPHISKSKNMWVVWLNCANGCYTLITDYDKKRLEEALRNSYYSYLIEEKPKDDTRI